jgi:hypothetical protein
MVVAGAGGVVPNLRLPAAMHDLGDGDGGNSAESIASVPVIAPQAAVAPARGFIALPLLPFPVNASRRPHAATRDFSEAFNHAGPDSGDDRSAAPRQETLP